MTDLMPMNTVGSVNSNLVSDVTVGYYSDYNSEHNNGLDSIIDTIDTMSDTIDTMSDNGTYRGDMITDVKN